jgi:hypothetical protein
MTNWFAIVYAVPRLLLFTLPFIFLYVLSKRFEKYHSTKHHLFYFSILFSLAGFVILALELVLNITSVGAVDLDWASDFSDVNVVFFFLSGLTLYLLSSDMQKTLSERVDNFYDLSIFGVFLLFLTFFFSVILSNAPPWLDPGRALFVPLKESLSLSAFFLLFLSFLRMADVYKRLGSAYYNSMIAAALLTSWQFFMVVQRLMGPISGVRLPEAMALGSHAFVTFSSVHLFVTLLTIILASLPSIPLLKQIRTPVSASHGKEDRDIVHFVEDMSELIGGSAITLFRKGLEEYNTEHNTTVRFDPKTGLSDKESSEDILSYVLNYFESLIGPVCRRVYEESKAEKRP